MNHWKKSLALGVVIASAPLMAGGDIEAVPAAPDAKSFFTPNYTWFDVSANYLDWSHGTQKRTKGSKADFLYLEFEGGMGWDWGDFYFFTDWENPGKGFDASKAPDDSRWVIKPVLDINIPGLAKDQWYSGFQFHIQDYYLYGDGFRVNNLVLGLAYKYQVENFFIRPFIGFHYTNDNFNPGKWNGYMAGWTFNYDFSLFDQKFSFSNWNEIEFDRDDTYGGPKSADGRSWGVNGALALWWHATDHITAGIQYRYADHKLGYSGYQDAVIYTVKYNF